jgi:hypothetical protein
LFSGGFRLHRWQLGKKGQARTSLKRLTDWDKRQEEPPYLALVELMREAEALIMEPK